MNGAQDTDKARLNERERDLAWAWLAVLRKQTRKSCPCSAPVPGLLAGQRKQCCPSASQSGSSMDLGRSDTAALPHARQT